MNIFNFQNQHTIFNFLQVCKNYLTYNSFWPLRLVTYHEKNERYQQEFSHWKFKFSIDKLCRFFFFFSSAPFSFLCRVLKNWMQSTMQNHRKEKCWHNKEMGLELKMLSSIQRKCHEMNFKRNDNFLACLHTMPFWWNLRHLSS